MISPKLIPLLSVDDATDDRLAFVEDLIRRRSIATADRHRIVSARGRERRWLFDLRPVLLNGRALSFIAEMFWERFAGAMPFQVGGLEVAAIPLVSAIAVEGERRGHSVNAFFVRKERKSRGLARIIEGDIIDAPVIVVDDLTNSSSSFEKVRVVVADHGSRVAGAFVVVDFKSQRSLEWRQEHDIEVASLFDITRFALPPAPPPAYRPAHRFEPLWSSASARPNQFIVAPASSPAYDGRTVYVGTDGGELRAIDAQSGVEAWSFQVPGKHIKGIRSSPAVVDGKVLFGAYDGCVYCLDAGTGQEVWRAQEAEWVGSSPAVSKRHGLVVVGLEHAVQSARGSIAAFELTSGKKVWEHTVSKYVHCSPVLSADEERIFVGTNGGDLLCLDALTGAVVWQYWTKGDLKCAPAVSESLGVVVVGSFDRCIHLVESATGKPIAVVRTGERIYSSPLIVGDVAYIGSPDKNLYVIDLVDGSVLKTFYLGSRIYATPVLLNGIVYVGATGGGLFGIDPATLTFRKVLQLPDHVLNPPLLAGDGTILVVPVFASRLFAFRAEEIVDRSTIPPPALHDAPRLKAPPISAVVIDVARGEGPYFRINEPVGRPVSRPYLAMPSRRLLGAATLLMMHSTGYKDLSQSEVKARVMPALLADQTRVFLYGLQPVGMVTWACLTEEAETDLVNGAGLPKQSAWTSGDRIWIIDVIAPFGGHQSMLDKVRRETLRGQTVRLLQPRAGGGFQTVTLAP